MRRLPRSLCVVAGAGGYNARDDHFASAMHNFYEIEQQLHALGAGLGAAELQGSIVGYLCAGKTQLNGFILDASLPDTPLLAPLFDGSRSALEEGSIALLLPDDDSAIADRAAALRHWCSGFLGGLGLGGMNKSIKLSSDAEELLSDLREIGRSEVSFDEDEESDENALMELIEYARMGAILLRDELGVR